MPQQSVAFRDFGILPENLQPPTGVVRGFISPARIGGQYIATALVILLAVATMGLLLWLAKPPLSYFGCVVTAICFSLFVYWATKDDYCQIELDGDELRARHLYTGRVITRRVPEIERLTSVIQHGGTAETAVTQQLLGRIKGMEIWFRNWRSPLRILRADPAMTNAQELLQAILYRMSQIDELEPEIIQYEGKPLVRTIYWKAEPPNLKPRQSWNALAVVGILMCLFLGPMLAFMGEVTKEEYEVSQQPPHEVSVADLIKNGPGGNRHVTITEFSPGGYVVEETQGGVWKEAWVALFPINAPQDEIKVIYSTKGASNEPALSLMMGQPKLTGMCTKTLRASWGATLGPEMVKSNNNAPLKAAWSIHELRNPPSAEFVKYVFFSSYAAFSGALLIAFVILARVALASVIIGEIDAIDAIRSL